MRDGHSRAASRGEERRHLGLRRGELLDARVAVVLPEPSVFAEEVGLHVDEDQRRVGRAHGELAVVETRHLRLGDERLGLRSLDAPSNHRLERKEEGSQSSVRFRHGRDSDSDRRRTTAGRTSASRRAASLSQSSRRHHPAAHPAINAAQTCVDVVIAPAARRSSCHGLTKTKHVACTKRKRTVLFGRRFQISAAVASRALSDPARAEASGSSVKGHVFQFRTRNSV